MAHSKVEYRVVNLEDSNAISSLIEGCSDCIGQYDQLLKVISQSVYIDNSNSSSSIGAYVRHILDRFHCFFSGLQDASIDYDASKRDKEIEQNIEAAMFAVVTVARRIEQLGDNPSIGNLICVRETVHPLSPAVEISSTIEREMMALITHSIHHLAIIALIARSFGYQMGEDFGKASSTIVYESA